MLHQVLIIPSSSPEDPREGEGEADTQLHDPPPPYPSRERRRRRLTVSRTGASASEDAPPHAALPQPWATYEDEEATETTPFLSPGSSRRTQTRTGRPRSYSHTSTLSAAPSLARTVLSLFDTAADTKPVPTTITKTRAGTVLHLMMDKHPCPPSAYEMPTKTIYQSILSLSSWRRYFRPLVRMPYYRALFHLLVLNFPYALVAWVYLFVFTVTGTTLLVALPLGALLCFFNLLGARAFARGELALQTTFHTPLSYPPSTPPRPIFTRLREPTAAELENGIRGLVWERSFYKNSWAMFTDPTSYQSLFYFLVIKPAITIIFSLLLLVFVVPAMVLILPAPAALRATRRLGRWQGNVAVEGLYLAVR
ncbi:hypothetical protein BDQ17DRAFT_1400536 [Cyathus striatus]|nr:hypothetical protein BDQ17DRAFT_1400536 [Cyathus striatus]